MKKRILIFLLALVGMTQLSAQESDYIPFVREGVKWVCYYNSYYGSTIYSIDNYYPIGKTYFTLELKGDTVINDQTYKKMHKYRGDGINEENDTVVVYLREENRIVYGIMPVLYYDMFYVGYGRMIYDPAVNIVQAARNGEEFVLYDFSDPENYYNTIYNGSISYLGCDEIPVGEKMARRYLYDCWDYHPRFIEGIGYDGYFSGYTLGYLYLSTRDDFVDSQYQGFFLSHVEENGKIIYKGINYEQVMPTDGRLPIVQEGKIWVNERVVINHGDTTRSYYSYEIRGDDPRYPNSDMKLCHYYTGTKIDPENDSIISTLYEYLMNISDVGSYYNWPLIENIEKNRTILRGPEMDSTGVANLLYWMQHGNAERTKYYYVARQNRPKVLTMDNFIAMDPVEIDGFMCERYAYVNEEGEPMAYLVEGIGFDSWCMGDLLTPFTREPDHGADYQEYCGLSHVIKNGKIIYKGMCYDEKRVQALNGDVNGDGLVNITDVTVLIDMLLNEGPVMRAHGDVDYSGEINITDVVRLIDLVLAN